jgi:hypothetical protein
MARRRRWLAALIAATVLLGIASRKLPLGWPAWDKSLGDVLYAMMVAFGLALALRRGAALAAFVACLAIEAFQLTGVPVALARERPWVHWVLGSSFAWHDVACYALGALAAAAILRALPAD